MTDDSLVAAAWAAREQAYAPYSRFRVGAAVLGDDGRIYQGANMENASYGLTICAERLAVGAAVTAGCRAIRRVVVVTDRDPPTPPCGACRQVLAEFGLDTPVEGHGPTGVARWTVKDLLPEAFTKERLA